LNEVSIIPNPASQSAVISFSLTQSENINLTVHDLAGKLIKTLFTGPLNKGEHQLSWNVNNDAVENGLYFLKLISENMSRSIKIVVVK
jgi:hypothetical protein